MTWFFLHDGAAMATVRASGSYAFDLSARGLTELAIGALALIIAMWVARRTSVGSIIVGVISILLGLPFLIAPGVMTDTFTPFLNNLSTQSALGQSLSTYLWTVCAAQDLLLVPPGASRRVRDDSDHHHEQAQARNLPVTASVHR